MYYNWSFLSSEVIELDRGYMGLILIKRAYIEMLARAGTGNMAKSFVV
jgi:hypothetical protein